MSKKRFMVVPRTGETKLDGLVTGRGHRKFKNRGAMFITDPAEAQEIDQRYGLKGDKRVWVQEDPGYEFHLKHDGSNGHNRDVHHYTFGSSSAYARAWEAFERRRKQPRKPAGQKGENP